MKSLLVLGATSHMARAISLEMAKYGWHPYLTGRNLDEVAKTARDMSIRLGRNVDYGLFEAGTTDASQFWSGLPQRPDGILCAVGLLGDQDLARHDPDLAARILTANYTGLVPVLNLAADEFEKLGTGLIIGISSVAGERGRASNYIYGSAKAGFTAYISGLRNRLAKKGVQVVTVKPGYALTRMTAGMDLPGLLTATPQEVAKAVWRAVLKGKDCVYVPCIWKYIMAVIRLLPENIFKRTNF